MQKFFISLIVVLALLLALAGMVMAGSVGSVTGTGEDINVSLGYTPSHVEACNQSNGSCLDWFTGMTADTALLRDALTNTIGTIVTNGVSSYSGSSGSASPGFSIGNHTSININGQTILYKVVR